MNKERYRGRNEILSSVGSEETTNGMDNFCLEAGGDKFGAGKLGPC